MHLNSPGTNVGVSICGGQSNTITPLCPKLLNLVANADLILWIRQFPCDRPQRVSVGQLCGERRNVVVSPTRGTVCIFNNGKGLPPLPRDCQGRLPVDWVNYDI